jgi:ComF family protein
MRPIDGIVCGICGERLASSYTISPADGVARCGLCQKLEVPFAKAAAYGSYEGGIRELIHLLKYEQVRPAATVLGRMLADAIESLTNEFAGRSPVIVPVPLHASKLRQRGFNQSELIAINAIKLLAAKGKDFQLKAWVIERCRATESQTGLTRHQRRENVRGAFKVVAPAEIQDCEILLVDDVFTTGTTVSECARILRRSGAARVWVATVARVLKPQATFVLERISSSEEQEFSEPRAMAARV